MVVKIDWKRLAKDKRLWAVAGIGGAAGLFVFIRRGGGDGPAGAAGAGEPGQQGGSYVQGAGNTTDTDIAGYLSQFSQSNLDAQSKFLSDLKTTIGSVGSGAGGGQTTPPTSSGLSAPGRIWDSNPSQWQDSIQLHWDKVNGATKYRIKNYAGGDDFIEVGDVDAYQLRNLVHNGSYFWQVSAGDGSGNWSPWSQYITTHTKN